MDSTPGPSNEIVRSRRSTRPPAVRVLHSESKEFAQHLEALVDETLGEELSDFDDSDEDPDFQYESLHETDSEISDRDETVVNDIEVRNEEVRQSPSNDQNILENVNNDVEIYQAETAEIDRTGENAQQNIHQASARRIRSEGTFYYGRQTKLMEKKNIAPFRWRKEPPNQGVKTRRKNIITQLPCLKPRAKALGENPDVESVWGLLISQDILEEIVRWTNVKINSTRLRYENPTSYIHDTDIVELKSFIGLLIYTAVFKSGHESAEAIFATDGTGREIFRSVMTKDRFLFLLQVLRFDDSSTRSERKKEVKEAAISQIFNKFIENSQSCYSMGAYVCVDEMLVAFRGRSSFRMYMPNKPAKYGLKVQCLTDARTHYLYNAFVYTGKNSEGRGLSAEQQNTLLIPTQSVLRLVIPIENTQRNVTADNWYTSIQLAEQLLDKNLTYLGTMKKNKNEIPSAFLPSKEREVGSSMYGYTEELTLLSQVPKKSKAVILVSSLHHGPAIDENSGKPEMIADYNRTKSGVDTVDQMCSNYSTSRRTRRWPMAIFFALINISAGVNSFILYKSYRDTECIPRIQYMKNLAKSLVTPGLQRRLDRGRLTEEMKLAIKRILQIADPPRPLVHEAVLEVRKTCSYCPPRIKRKTKYICRVCGKAICLECAKKVCVQCAGDL